MSGGFNAATLGMFLGVSAPLLKLLGVDVENLTLDKAEDFGALKNVGQQLMELGAVGEEKLGDGSVDPGDLPAIFAEARDLPGVTKVLLGELKDQHANEDETQETDPDPAPPGD